MSTGIGGGGEFGTEPETGGPLYHLAEAAAWEAARASGTYRESTLGRSLVQEGFIHLSGARQWEATRRRFYAAYPDALVLLTIDPARLTSQVRWEVGDAATGERFPHLYGPLEVTAVVETEVLAAPHA